MQSSDEKAVSYYLRFLFFVLIRNAALVHLEKHVYFKYFQDSQLSKVVLD